MKLKKILISQPEPADLEKSPYKRLASEFKLDLTFYKDLDDFFHAYSAAGIFDDAFVESTKKDASEMHDVLFTLYALYDGDEEAVPIITNGEMFVLKNAEGAYLFG